MLLHLRQLQPGPASDAGAGTQGYYSFLTGIKPQAFLSAVLLALALMLLPLK